MKHLAKDKDSKVVEDAEEKVKTLLFTFNQHLRNKYDRYYYGFVSCEVNIISLDSYFIFLDYTSVQQPRHRDPPALSDQQLPR